MKIIQYYIKLDNMEINNELEKLRRNLLKLKDTLNAYRIPPSLTKIDKIKKNVINKIKMVIFYLELILIETEKTIYDFEESTLDFKDNDNIEEVLNIFSECDKKINNLLLQLDNFGDLTQFKNIFDLIEPEIEKLYPKSKDIEKILKLSKKANLLKIEREKLPTILKIEREEKKEVKEKKIIQPLETAEENNEVLRNIFERFSLKVPNKSQLIDSIVSIGDSKITNELGGVVKITALYNFIKDENKDLDFTLDDLNKVLKYMRKKGYISDIEEIENLKLVKFIPLELSSDPKLLLESVGFEGVETKENLMKKLNWPESRVDEVLRFLIDKGICKSENNSLISERFYFPGLV